MNVNLGCLSSSKHVNADYLCIDIAPFDLSMFLLFMSCSLLQPFHSSIKIIENLQPQWQVVYMIQSIWNLTNVLSFDVGGIDHVHVHPRFLHLNATNHRWALGGMFACHRLLMDNRLKTFEEKLGNLRQQL
jgi:hypothetical protein